MALSAFHSFCARAARRQFPRLEDRDDLWRVLATITTRKVISRVRHQSRQKRGGGNVLGESAVLEGIGAGDSAGEGLAHLLGREPTPEAAAEFADEFDRLLARLDDPTLRSIALCKLEGRTTEEIAEALGTSTRTIDRKLRLIRALWEDRATEEKDR